ncbi:transporter substrate-binding protein [Bacillus sp. sid0103]|uniref:transporter substrate-binding protein n=1 Tax=Bacillus sp. sid0103 TaxID=2856337 RepID=UPI001C438FA9|nr:transporter substrate-binding protein [Bacillus sp. sid0103]MBV7508616.1 transporter substrate-binding protein [Bacillus sp. sid0103]
MKAKNNIPISSIAGRCQLYLIHFIPWIADHIGKNFYLIGSDYIYPHETNAHIRSLLQVYQGKVLVEDYTPLGKQKFEENVKKIQELVPDIVFSTLVGSSAVAFYKQYYEAGIKKPIASLITAETEVAALDPKCTVGHFLKKFTKFAKC